MDIMICKGCPITIGTSIEHTRYFDYTLREALKEYRKKHGLQRKHLKITYVNKYEFGYVF